MGIFNEHYFHKSSRQYKAVMMKIMSDLKIHTEGKLVQIPLTNMGGKRDQTQQGVNGTYPRATIKFDGYQKSQERQLHKNNRSLVLHDKSGSQKQRVAMDFLFTYSVRCKKQSDVEQLVEQIVPAFEPSVDFKFYDNADLKNHQNIKIKLESFETPDNWEGDGEEPDYYDAAFTFRLAGYLYRASSGTGVIESVHVDLTICNGTEFDDSTDEFIEDWVVVTMEDL